MRDTRFSSPISQQIWDSKYRFKDGPSPDGSVEDTFRRVAKAVAKAETTADLKKDWEALFYELMASGQFLPAGRILAGAGTDRAVTLFNCYVMGRIDDSMPSIMENLHEAAVTMQQGGGIGHDFSTIRPKGAAVKGVGTTASGPMSFMDMWDTMCRTIMSAGHRRGAMMGTMRCDHPDIEDFIEAKRDKTRLRNFNLSVLVTDGFMEAVKENRSWYLVFDGKTYKAVSARDLWNKIMRATYDMAEPGVIFIDKINQRNNLRYCEEIFATNPCGEQPLPPYGACLLGSLNLTAFVNNPFSAQAKIDYTALVRAAGVAVRFLDNVIDISNYPLEAQKKEARAKRRIGLGFTGLADALIMLGERYESQGGNNIAENIASTIRNAAYSASSKLAEEKGCFPLYSFVDMMAAPHVRGLKNEVRKDISEHGLRNGLLTSIAPTGTISLFAGNVSSGIEPVFSTSTKRRIRDESDPSGWREEILESYSAALWRSMFGERQRPDWFVTADQVSPTDHVTMQAVVQRHIDSSISKTINVPEDLPFDEFRHVYADAYFRGLKGCTTFRPNDITGSILAAADAKPAKPVAVEGSNVVPIVRVTDLVPRDPVLKGRTYKTRWEDHALYVTINDIEQEGRRRPFEIFINTKSPEHHAWTVAFTRMVSAIFRRGGDVSFVIEELKAVFDPRGGQWMNQQYVPSLQAALGGIIEQHLAGLSPATSVSSEAMPAAEVVAVGNTAMTAMSVRPSGKQCPACLSMTVVRREGCDVCTSCAYNKCG